MKAKETYLSRDFREPAADASKEKQYHLKRQI